MVKTKESLSTTTWKKKGQKINTQRAQKSKATNVTRGKKDGRLALARELKLLITFILSIKIE